jgi:hypothetical protein
MNLVHNITPELREIFAGNILLLLGSVVLFVILLLVTSIVFHRVVTSELLIIHLWMVLELCAITVMYGMGRFDAGRAVALSVLVGLSFIVSLVCYILYYRLSGMESYYTGILPLAISSFVTAVFLLLVVV